MRYNTIILSVLIFISLCGQSHAADNDKAVNQKKKRSPQAVHILGTAIEKAEKVRLFILSGQSNMAGLDETSSLTPTLVKAFPKDHLIIVKDAQSGQPIRRWYKNWKPVGEWEAPSHGKRPGVIPLYIRLMESVQSSIEGKQIDSAVFMWMQGEADAKSGQSSNYQESITGLINDIRRDIKFPKMAAVIGRLSDYEAENEHWVALRAAQMACADADPLVNWIDTDDYNGKKDGLHYSKEGYIALGEAFAKSAITLLQAK